MSSFYRFGNWKIDIVGQKNGCQTLLYSGRKLKAFAAANYTTSARVK
jgi:hypothetical protein